MEASTLRWILIIAGVLLLIAIRFFWNPNAEKKPKASRRRQAERADSERREPTLAGNEVASSQEQAGDAAEDTLQGELNIDDPVSRREPSFGESSRGDDAVMGAAPGAETARRSSPPKSSRPAGPPPDRILSLFLLARDNHRITGAELLQATVNTGMDFGDMNIFHRLPEGSENPLFSMANAEKPGHFERDEWNTFETTGVVIFMTLPAEITALDTWDSMLAAARRMGDILNAELLDEQRHPFSRQSEAKIREEMREYDRKKSDRAK